MDAVQEPITCLNVERGGTRLTVQWFEETPPTVDDSDRIRLHVRRTLDLAGEWSETTIWMTPQEAMLIEAGLGVARTCEACCVPAGEGDEYLGAIAGECVPDETIWPPRFDFVTEGGDPREVRQP